MTQTAQTGATMNRVLRRMMLWKPFCEQLRQDDPKSGFTPHSIRMLGLQGKIPMVAIGKKRLYDYDAFLEILATNPESLSIDSTAEPATATPLLPVRRIAGGKG